MTLSISCKAAIKAVVFLASNNEPGQKISIAAVSRHIGASGHTVGKLLQTLVKGGLIKSSKGPGGGFYITADQKKVPVMKIIEAIDGMDVFKVCGLGLSRCNSSRPCPIHFEYKKARDIYQHIFENNRIADFCKQVVGKEAWLT